MTSVAGGLNRTEARVLFCLAIAALVISGINPFDRLTWVMEVLPAMIGLVLCYITRRTFPLTPLLYRLLFAHALGLMLGGHYSYARVPLGDWVKDAFDLSRNHFDRLGHFAQGFVPAVLTRELLLRRTPLQRGGWLFFLSFSVPLAFSAFYELVEWWAAVLVADGAVEFLGTQGDPWDAQWDMFLALLGAWVALVMLPARHDRQLRALLPTEVESPASPS